MTFQRCTTFDQTLKLKELGLPQCNGSAYVDVRGEQFYAEKDLCSLENHTHEFSARVLTRQEIEDDLRRDFFLAISTVLNIDDLLESTSLMLYKPSAKVTAEEPYQGVFGCTTEGRDPFPALYAARAWQAEQKATVPIASTP